MKTIFILTLLMSFSVHANWVAKSAIKVPQTIWVKKNKCELASGEECFNIKGVDIRKVMIGPVDDLTKPNLRAIEASPVKLDCDDFSDCQSKAVTLDNDGLIVTRVCLADESVERWDDLVNHPGVTGVAGPWFIWCEKPNGTFQQKDALVPDPAGSAAADAEDAAKAAKESAVGAKKAQCDIDSDKPTMTLPEVTACIKAILGKE